MSSNTHLRGDREKVAPLKVNAFEAARRAASQLTPLFPYMHPGSIVPCCSTLESDGSGANIGYFLHMNTVDEVALTLGGEGRNATGDVFVGPREHGVGRSPPSAFFAVQLVTQRQLESGEQPEALTFQCDQCSKPLVRHEFNAGIAGEGRFAGLPTLMGSQAAVDAFNSTVEARTCSDCGHVSQPFPAPLWGWARYVRNTRIVQKGWRALRGSDE